MTTCQEGLEAMQLHGVLWDALPGKEVLNLDPLITLELDNLSSLLVFDEGTIASELLQDRNNQRPVK